MKPSPTKTTNRIHFSDLDPIRFEDLCLNIIQRQKEWIDLRHYGRQGKDNGIDILGVDENSENWYFQCKRYIKIGLNDVISVVNKIKDSKDTLPEHIVLFVSCDVSKSHYEKFIHYSKEIGINSAQIWTSSKIESILYKSHHDLLFTYFGISIPKETKNNVAKLRHSLKMKKRIAKDFIKKDLDVKYISKYTHYEPRMKFSVGEIIIRDIDNDTYPDFNKKKGISEWFKVELYNLYLNGIEIYLYHPRELIYNENYNWDLLHQENDNRKKKYKSISVNMIGRISYSNILEYDFDGDNYYPMPHIFCRFDLNEMPYESIEYYTYGDSLQKLAPHHFEKNMRIELK